MRRSMLVMCALLAGTTLGCAKIKEALNKRKNRNQTPATQTAARDTTKKPGTPAAPAGVQPPPVASPPSTRPAAPAPVLHDVPYNSPDTGTVAPGMGENDVVTLWGPPSAVRHAGSFTYLHYPNGCERSCGTDDVVILQDGQVVDAIVRWAGHGYSGQSTSPPGRTPMPTLQ
jgi:hypothetical protein